MLPVAFAEEFDRIYDVNGNLISDGKYYSEYNGLNQLVKVRLGNTSDSPLAETYLWHPIEERIVIKRVFYNGVYNYTVYYPNKEYVRIVNSSGTFDEVYVRDGENILAQVDTDGNKIAVHNDHEGSNTLITDLNGNVVENTFYSPFGEIIDGGKASRFDYEGKEFDSLTDRLDFGFRQIDPSVPVWDKPDTLIQDVYDPQSLNRYSFERNNPYRYIDPSGHNTAIIDLIINLIRSLLIRLGLKALGEDTSGLGFEHIISRREDPAEKSLEELRNQPDYVLAMSDKAKLSPDSYAAKEGPFKIGDNANLQGNEQLTETQVTTTGIKKEENEDDILLEDNRIKDDKLPDANKLVNQVKKKEDNEKPAGKGGGGGDGSGGGNPGYWATCTQVCTTTIVNGNPITKCKWVCTTK